MNAPVWCVDLIFFDWNVWQPDEQASSGRSRLHRNFQATLTRSGDVGRMFWYVLICEIQESDWVQYTIAGSSVR